MHESSPGYGPGCGLGCRPALLRSILDRSRISHGLNMDGPGMYSWMTWKQVALAGREPNKSCQPMIMIPPETYQSLVSFKSSTSEVAKMSSSLTWC